MKGKRVFYSEFAYVAGVILLALGTTCMERANFGMSMVVAPAYLIHLKVSEYLPFFTFGMSEYVFQAVLLVILSLIVRKIKKVYFLSFATAFIYGIVLDALLNIAAFFPFDGIMWRIALYISGLFICSSGIALFFSTYLPPEAYELFVKVIAEKYSLTIGRTKTVYDCVSFALSVILSLCFYRTFVGIGFGTVICAAANGFMIERISRFLNTKFVFKDALPLRNKLR